MSSFYNLCFVYHFVKYTSWLIELFTYFCADHPRDLKHYCRLVLRRQIGAKRLLFIPELPVPKSLQEYLDFRFCWIFCVFGKSGTYMYINLWWKFNYWFIDGNKIILINQSFHHYKCISMVNARLKACTVQTKYNVCPIGHSFIKYKDGL